MNFLQMAGTIGGFAAIGAGFHFFYDTFNRSREFSLDGGTIRVLGCMALMILGSVVLGISQGW